MCAIKSSLTAVTMALLILMPCLSAQADTVILKSGEHIKGLITVESAERIEVKEPVGLGIRTHNIRTEDIEEIDKGDSGLYADRIGKIETADQARREAIREEKREKERLVREAAQKEKEAKEEGKKKGKTAQVSENALGSQDPRDIAAKKEKARKEHEKNVAQKRAREVEEFVFIEKEPYSIGNLVYYEGEVTNTGKEKRPFVKIKAEFFDMNKKLVATANCLTDPMDLAAGQTGRYKLSINASLNVVDYTIAPIWLRSDNLATMNLGQDDGSLKMKLGTMADKAASQE